MQQRYKYPRTPHLPWSYRKNSDDDMLPNVDHLLGKEVVITEKLDGENTSCYSDYIHARSIDSRHHLSRNWVKMFHATFAHLIPNNVRICGENMYAKHSIYYTNLLTYFYVHSIWKKDVCLSWDETVNLVADLGLVTVPIIARCTFNINLITQLTEQLNYEQSEGYVIRVVEAFQFAQFGTNMAKFVRPNHVQTSQHWMTDKIIPNQLKT
ncbi:MAG: RNA ligase family protein [Nitrososphaeraceae archaeon]